MQPLTMQCIDHKLKHQQKSGTSGVCIYKCFVAIQVGMQGINKTQEKRAITLPWRYRYKNSQSVIDYL